MLSGQLLISGVPAPMSPFLPRLLALTPFHPLLPAIPPPPLPSPFLGLPTPDGVYSYLPQRRALPLGLGGSIVQARTGGAETYHLVVHCICCGYTTVLLPPLGGMISLETDNPETPLSGTNWLGQFV